MVSQRVDARGRATADNLTIQVKWSNTWVIGNYEKRLIPLLLQAGVSRIPSGPTRVLRPSP